MDSLTPEQREAVEHVDGPLLILAGPGSGKTRVVTHRVAHLLSQGIASWQILALTFTNKAAEAMRERIELLAPGSPVWVGTFHRFCARLLRQYAAHVGLAENYTIYDTSDCKRVIRRVIEQVGADLTLTTPNQIIGGISWAKNNLVAPEEYKPKPGSMLGSTLAKIYPAYQQQLRLSNAVDFDDLLMYVAVLLKNNPELRTTLDARYRYILVDEYQDTNLAQYAIVRALSINYPNLAVTGDPDQSIYGWRGANLRNILDFEKDYPNVHVVRLERNYRSTQNILQVADQLIGHNVQRKVKALYTENEVGRLVRLVRCRNEKEEAESIAAQIASDIDAGRRRPRDFAIFYRVNALSRTLEDSMRSHGIPYQIVRGVEFYQRQEIKDVVAYLQLLNNPCDDVALLRVINTPTRGIGKTTIQSIRAFAEERRIPLLEAARQAGSMETLKPRAALAVARFVTIMDRLGEVAMAPIEEILGHVLNLSGYRERLMKSKDEEDQNRLANIEEILTVARQFDTENPGEGHLEAFLEQSALVNDTDDWETENDRVTLMTLHAAKGLEFPVVFLIAVEQGLLPHERSSSDRSQLEEERRLLFVGITRAESELRLSLATQRDFRGRRQYTIPSDFLMELRCAALEFVDEGMGIDQPEMSQTWQAAEMPEPWEIASLKLEIQELRASLASQDVSSSEEETAINASTRKSTASPTETAPPAWTDEEFVQAEKSDSDDSDACPAALSSITASLKTAAAMLPKNQPSDANEGGNNGVDNGAEEPLAVSPDAFHLGMVVTHPKHGLGKIVALSGEGKNRRATINFASAGQKKYVLAKSPLRPLTRR